MPQVPLTPIEGPPVLVIDVGSSSVRSSLVDPSGAVREVARRAVGPITPAAGMVEVDAVALAEAVLETAGAAASEATAAGGVAAVGVAAQRATTLLWDRSSGTPLANAISWQDVRTVGQCLSLRRQGIRLTPNQSATKLAYLLDKHDRDRARDLCFGTVDSWVLWTLSKGALHLTDATNAALTGLVTTDAAGWDASILEALRVPSSILPAIVDSASVLGTASALPGAPLIAGVAGDQQASLLGQGCLQAGEAKATFGTGAMLDCVTAVRPGFDLRGPQGTFPIVTHSVAGERRWGVEAILLSAGAAVDWLVGGLGVLETAEQSDAVAAGVRDAAGVVFVPALGGLGTPVWDFGARGQLSGLHPAAGRAEVVRAVLEGIAHSGADLLEAAEADTGVSVPALRVDGGMSANVTFLQALADATGRPIQPAALREATTLGAAFLAGSAVGIWPDLAAAAKLATGREVVEPRRRLDRERWLEARARSERNVPFLSRLAF
ncbi:MAG TPA: FGGY family carbohydrate kinase [Acidimicrobiales bacterium]|nr:FGGY family carbohydrate kinase [Acidimicrobiales bacterium]